MSGFKNADKFKAKLSKLPSAVSVAARAALEGGASDTVDAMRAAAPHRTGALSGTINWTYGKPPSDARLVSVKAPAVINDHKITIFAGSLKAFYARWVEFGTKARSAGSYRDKLNKKRNAGKHGHAATPAEPFFYPVWRMMRPSVRRRITSETNKAIKALAGGNGGN